MKQFLIILVFLLYVFNIVDYLVVKTRKENNSALCASYMKTNLAVKLFLFGIGNACLDEGFYPLKEQTGEAKNE